MGVRNKQVPKNLVKEPVITHIGGGNDINPFGEKAL